MNTLFYEYYTNIPTLDILQATFNTKSSNNNNKKNTVKKLRNKFLRLSVPFLLYVYMYEIVNGHFILTIRGCHCQKRSSKL